MNQSAMNTNDIISQIEMNKAIIQRYFDAYNNKNETIFDEIISSDYIDHGHMILRAPLEEELMEQKMTLGVLWIN
jgi:hypothetical protein